MIVVEKLCKSFDGNNILRDISTQFEKGKTNLIIGQSGSGKTVLLKCILGLYGIDSGNIFFENRSLQKMDSKERSVLRQEMGMVFQGSALFDSMTVEENIMFPMRMLTQKVLMKCFPKPMKLSTESTWLTPIKNFLRDFWRNAKRVAIARAVVMNPKYLFCDEPNSGLDPKTSTLIDNLIQEITKEYQITTVINTHDMNSVMEIGEKVLFLENGRKGWEGSNREVFKTENESVGNFIYSSNLFKK